MLGDMNKAKELWRGSQDLGLNFMALRNRPNVNAVRTGCESGFKGESKSILFSPHPEATMQSYIKISLSRGKRIRTETLLKYLLYPTRIIWHLICSQKQLYETGFPYADFQKRKVNL